jgi:hypothetical protein
MLNKVFEGEKVKVMVIPDIESVNWGRGVGYELNEWVPNIEISSISATTIRNSIKSNTDDWKEMVDSSIHEDIIQYLKENNLIVA